MKLCAAPLLLVLRALGYFSFASSALRMNPRIIQNQPAGRQQLFSLPLEENNPVFYLDAQKSLYIGGRASLFQLDFKTTNSSLSSLQNECKTDATFMGQLDGKLVVCGTNTSRSACCKIGENSVERPLAEQMSPAPGDNYIILITGKDVYSTIPRKSNNAARKIIFRKIEGKEPYLYTSSNFMRNPIFVKSLAVERENHVQNKIFLFFMEDNTEIRTTQKRVPMIGRMCKEENGSEKADTRNTFSTALKTRLMCGNPNAEQYYPFLQDIYFLETQDLIYGLFTNAWQQSAVCSYKVEDIELVFNTSDLFGSSKKDLKIRPGTCLPDGKRTPKETSEEIASYPELTSWVWPSGNQSVFQTLQNYRKLVVDEISAVDNKSYRVIILATDNGSLHKVVEYDDGAMNILELHPFRNPSEILHLELDPNKTDHVLYVGSAHEVSRLPLDDCSAYNNTCASCLLARDPYCGWALGQCQSVLMNKVVKLSQTLTAASTDDMCEPETTTEFQRGCPHTPANKDNAQPPSTYYLACPAESKQATYWWTNGNKYMQNCTPQNGICYLLFNQVTYPGKYQCMARELSTERVVSSYTYFMENNSARTQYTWLVLLPVLLYTVYHMV